MIFFLLIIPTIEPLFLCICKYVNFSRRNQIEDGNAECGDMEHEEGNKKKKKEKKVKFFPSFELIKGSVTVTCEYLF